MTSSQSILTTSRRLPTIPKLIERHVLAFKDSTDEKFAPIYQIISEDNIVTESLIDIVSAGLTECELWLLKFHTQESATIKVLIDKLLTWYQ